MLSRLIAVLMLGSLLVGCDDNPTSPQSDLSICGTWIGHHYTSWNADGDIIYDFDIAVLGGQIIRSIFPQGFMQQLNDLPGSQFLLYQRYDLDGTKLWTIPDSLLDTENIIHIWQAADSTFSPPFPLQVKPFESNISSEQDSMMVERAENDNGEIIEAMWRRSGENATDLRDALLSSANVCPNSPSSSFLYFRSSATRAVSCQNVDVRK